MLLAITLFSLSLAGADSRSIFSAAEQALKANELTKAEQGFREFLKLHPNHVGALGNLGVVCSRLGRYQEAIATYERALKIVPDSPDLNLNLGLAWLKQDDHAAARPYFERAASLRAGHLQTKELLATSQLYTDQVNEAVMTLESLPPSPSVQYLLSVGYLKQNEREKARKIVAHLFENLRPAQAHLLAGRAHYESTLFEESLTELIKARELDPDLPGLWRELGKTQVSLRQSADARATLREAVRRDPGDIEAVYFLGALLIQEDSESEGIALLERARAARPSFWGAWYYLGKAALASGQPARASELLRRAAELQPNQPSVLYQLARALKGAGKDTESRVIMQKYLQLKANSQNAADEALVVR